MVESRPFCRSQTTRLKKLQGFVELLRQSFYAEAATKSNQRSCGAALPQRPKNWQTPGKRVTKLGWRLEAIASRFEDIALRVEAIAPRLEAIAFRLENVSLKFHFRPSSTGPIALLALSRWAIFVLL